MAYMFDKDGMERLKEEGWRGYKKFVKLRRTASNAIRALERLESKSDKGFWNLILDDPRLHERVRMILQSTSRTMGKIYSERDGLAKKFPFAEEEINSLNLRIEDYERTYSSSIEKYERHVPEEMRRELEVEART